MLNCDEVATDTQPFPHGALGLRRSCRNIPNSENGPGVCISIMTSFNMGHPLGRV